MTDDPWVTIRSLGIRMPLQSQRFGVDEPAGSKKREVGSVVCSDGWRGPYTKIGSSQPLWRDNTSNPGGMVAPGVNLVEVPRSEVLLAQVNERRGSQSQTFVLRRV